MPLVIVCGLPCSGKTTAAKSLYSHLSKNVSNKNIILINDESLNTDRETSYLTSNDEKKIRGNFLSAVERATNRENIVIADGMNYIKGFRYQLYCFARATATPHCVLYCVTPEEVCRGRNTLRRERGENTYPPDTLEELMMRFEEPNNQTKWDSPMFTIGDEVDQFDWEPLTSTLLGNVSRPPSLATAVKTVNSGQLVIVLDKVTQKMIEKVQSTVKENGVPIDVIFEDGSVVSMKRPIMISDLQRLRRQFIHMNRLHQISPESIEPLFAQYLNNNM